jgi:hypothetical protein
MKRTLFAVAVPVIALAVTVALATATPVRAGASGPLTSLGSTNLSGLPSSTGSAEFAGSSDLRPESEIAREASASGADKFWAWFHKVLPPSIPTPGGTAISTAGSELTSSFQGLNHFDQRTANGGNQFSLEPPDQGLCTGNGQIVEAVNDVMSVYSAGGTRTPVVDLNTFFGLPAAINRTTGARGDFLSDPKCYFDTATNRFFLTILQEDPAPSPRAHTLIAVSKTGDATGSWWLYSLDATDDGLNGTPSHPGCPCFGDQPLIGADKNGFYISTNEFGATFNGAQIYAMSKTALENGTVPPVVQFQSPPLAESLAYSVQPATSPTSASYDTANGGTEYFLSSLDFDGTLDNRVAAWAIINTKSLNSATPKLTLQSLVVPSENYATPVPADQKAGPHPLGDIGAPSLLGGPAGQPENTLNSNDDRMNQAVYVGGYLWGGVNTLFKDAHGDSKSGIAWFKVFAKSLPVGKFMLAAVVKQGYVAPTGENVLFPSIGVTPAGKAVMVFTLSGPDYFPTAAYSVFDGSGFHTIKVASAGVGPADGFTGYQPIAPDGVERWGDYSAAVSTPDGTVWVAQEYIAQSCTDAQYAADTTCGGTRTSLANWSTRISAVHP